MLTFMLTFMAALGEHAHAASQTHASPPLQTQK